MTKRILIDLNPTIVNTKTGVGYYVSHLANSLEKSLAPGDSIVGYLFNFLGRKHPTATVSNIHETRLLPAQLLSLSRRLGFQLPLRLFVPKRADVVLFTNYVSLPTRKSEVLFIYDLSFLDYPEFMQPINMRFLRRFCPPSIQKADLIITISEFTKERLLHHFPDLKAEIVITPIPPVTTGMAEVVSLPNTLTRRGILAHKYILYVGTIEPRKNLQNLVEAYAMLPDKVRADYSLVLAGGKGWKDEAILETIKAKQTEGFDIIQTGYVNDEEKAALYANAACFVLPSHYEGFGMPIFEAFQQDLPVAASDIPVFHEVAGNAALYFDKDNPAAITSALEEVLQNKSLRGKLVAQGRKQLGKYSWAENARVVSDAITRITS